MSADKGIEGNPDFGPPQMWKVTINAPIETVWNTLVKTDEVLPFLFGGVCQADGALASGKSFRMVSRDGKFATVVGRVLEFTPPTRFSHTISFTQVQGEQPGRTTYDLKEVSGGTEVTLIAEAVAGSKTARMAKTGPFIVGNLKRYVETGKPAFSGAMVMALAPVMSVFARRITRIENWPLEGRA